MSNTSIGRGPASGGNENHDGDPRNTTLGETVGQEPPAGVEEGGAAREPTAPAAPVLQDNGRARPEDRTPS